MVFLYRDYCLDMEGYNRIMKKYMKNTYCEEIVCGDYTLLLNHQTSMYFKLYHSIWNNIQYYIENGMEVDLQLRPIFEKLLEEKIILNQYESKSQYKSIMIQLTDSCNLNCKHCCAKMIKKNGIMSKEIIDTVISLEPEKIVLTGGEPMMHPQFMMTLKYIHQNYHGIIVLMTNGTLIDDNNIDELCSNIDFFDISIDGTNEHDTNIVRGYGVYKKVETTIKKLVQRGQRVNVSAVQECCSSDKEFHKWAKRLGATSTMRMLNIVDEVEKNFDLLISGGKERYIEDICQEFRNAKLNGHMCSCGMSRYELVVGVDGTIYPCGGLVDEHYIIGNINNYENLKERKDIIEALLQEPILQKCKNCIYRGGCWGCLSEVKNYSRYPEVFQEYCSFNKRKWRRILEKEDFDAEI